MGIIRGRIWYPKFYPPVHEVNGPSPFTKCEKTGEMYVIETGEPVVTMTLEELLKEYNPECKHCAKKN